MTNRHLSKSVSKAVVLCCVVLFPAIATENEDRSVPCTPPQYDQVLMVTRASLSDAQDRLTCRYIKRNEMNT